MITSILLIAYAAASVALAFWVRRAVKLRLDWAHPRMRAPVFSGTVRSTGSEGALGAADAVSMAVLSSASPNAVMVFVIVATVNAVNLTDGVDGLATGTSMPVFVFYTVVAAVWGEKYLALGVFSAGIFGGLCGFGKAGDGVQNVLFGHGAWGHK